MPILVVQSTFGDGELDGPITKCLLALCSSEGIALVPTLSRQSADLDFDEVYQHLAVHTCAHVDGTCMMLL